MNRIGIGGGRVLVDRVLQDRAVLTRGDRIESIGEKPCDQTDSIDATDLIVSPGLIDLQVNGGAGIDLQDDPGSVWRLAEVLPRYGVTAFLPTMITSPPDRTSALLATLARRPPGFAGAEPLGAHFEGPMLNPERPGAHPIDHLRMPSEAVIDGWSAESGVALVTIAPELPNATATISLLLERGVVVAAGHSDADAAEALAGFAAGVSMVTHLFNAMAPLSHRAPNLVGATLADNSVVAGLIVDGVHVDPIVVRAAWNAKGPDQLALVTDAVAAMGQPPGQYKLGDATITSDGSAVRKTDGTLAGSVLTMNAAVRNLCTFTACSPAEALRAATATPARVVGATQRGEIRPEAVADLAFLDHNLDVQITMCRGRVVFVAEAARDRLSTRLRTSSQWK